MFSLFVGGPIDGQMVEVPDQMGTAELQGPDGKTNFYNRQVFAMAEAEAEEEEDNEAAYIVYIHEDIDAFQLPQILFNTYRDSREQLDLRISFH